MTHTDFFTAVKGKRIRWNSWPECYYFIPETIEDTNDGVIVGKIFIPNVPASEFRLFISAGFDYSAFNGRWELWTGRT